MNTIQDQKGVARIGTGNKLHPAIKTGNGYLIFQCSCSGTRSGWAYHKSTFYSQEKYPNLTQTCKN